MSNIAVCLQVRTRNGLCGQLQDVRIDEPGNHVSSLKAISQFQQCRVTCVARECCRGARIPLDCGGWRTANGRCQVYAVWFAQERLMSISNRTDGALRITSAFTLARRLCPKPPSALYSTTLPHSWGSENVCSNTSVWANVLRGSTSGFICLYREQSSCLWLEDDPQTDRATAYTPAI